VFARQSKVGPRARHNRTCGRARGEVRVRDAFRCWLGEKGHTERTQATQWAQASRMEKLYCDLDAAFDSDRFARIRRELEYSKDDERRGRKNPAKIAIAGLHSGALQNTPQAMQCLKP
jgi:hypothetical protein